MWWSVHEDCNSKTYEQVDSECVMTFSVYVRLQKSPSLQISASKHLSSSPMLSFSLCLTFTLSLFCCTSLARILRKAPQNPSKSSRINNYWTMLFLFSRHLCWWCSLMCLYIVLSLPPSGFGHLCWQQLWGFSWLGKQMRSKQSVRQTDRQSD